MPSLGADMQAATLQAWNVEPGDVVSRGDIIAEIETEKGTIDVEVFTDGEVAELVARPGERLPVGAVLARIRPDEEVRGVADGDRAGGAVSPAAPGAPDDALDDHSAGGVDRVTAREGGQPEAIREERAPEDGSGAGRRPRRRVRASPLARQVAKDLGVDLHSVTGSGPEGAIQRADVEAAARRPQAPTPATEHERARSDETEAPSSGARQAIARAMAQANREIPHYYLETRINMQAALDWLRAENERRSVEDRLLPVVLLLKAVAAGLDEVPSLNGYWRNDCHEPQEAVHLGVAISLRQGGLVTPAIHDADRKSPGEIMADLDDLISRARRGRLRSSELTDATITVTSLADVGVEAVHGVIYPPQTALVGFGGIREQPWAENGLLGVRPVVCATLAADHRATDGRDGARFLAAVAAALQDPDQLSSPR